MIDQFLSFFNVLSELRKKHLTESLKVLFISILILVPATYLIQKIMAVVVGNGWSGETAWQVWNNMFSEITTIGGGGLTKILEYGESTVFFSAFYSGIQMFIVFSLQIFMSGFFAWTIYQIVRKKKTLSESLSGFLKPCFRYLWGMWLTISPILFAGLIGAIVQVYVLTETTNSGFTPWSIIASAAVIFLVYIFLRATFLPYIRLESSERFADSIKYAVHLSAGNITFILIILVPVVLLALVITYFTRAIPFIKTITTAIGVFMITVAETALFLSLTEKKQKPGIEETKELLG